MTFTDGLTVSAIVLALLAIVSEVVFFIVQTDRAAKSQREISDYVGQMREVLGKIEGLTTSTGSRLETITAQMVSGLLGRAGPPAEPPPVAGGKGPGELHAWRIDRGVTILRRPGPGRAAVDRLVHGPRDLESLVSEVVALAPKDKGTLDWALELMAVMAVLRILDLVAYGGDEKAVSLTAEGREVARRVAEGDHETESPADGKAAS